MASNAMGALMRNSALKLLFVVSLAFIYGDCKSVRMPKLSLRRRTTETSLPNSPLKNLTTFYYTQRLDHFNYNPESYTTFQQRYIIDFTHWGGPHAAAPIFAYLGGESSIDADLGIGFFHENAPTFHALQIFIEHRYYGESIPFGSLDEATRNATTLGYLNSAQALADYAQVLLHIQQNYSAHTSPIIVFGGSYGGMLASWFRLKYPHIARGALASSAPIFYFVDSLLGKGYYDIVSKDFRETSKSCYETIRKSWPEIDRLGSTPDGLSNLTSKFKSCEKFNASGDLKDYLVDMYAEAAQYDTPWSHPVRTICEAIDRVGSQTDILGRIAEALFSLKGNKSCYHFYGEPDEEFNIQWDWQVCTEMAMPIGVDKHKNTMLPYDPFDWNFFMNVYCHDFYGVWPVPQWVPTYYGGHELATSLRHFGSNIIFSNGLRDPYSAGGVLESISDSIVALSTVNGSHCLDLEASSESDPTWLVNQRKKEVEIIKEWISSSPVDHVISSGASHSLFGSLILVPFLICCFHLLSRQC